MKQEQTSQIGALQSLVEQRRDALNVFDAPFAVRTSELEKEWDIAREPHKLALEQAEQELNETRMAERAKQGEKLNGLVTDSIPDFATFKEFADMARTWFNKNMHSFYGSDATEVRPPKVPFLKLLAIAESKRAGATKYYGAWSERTQKLVGILSIDPAKHPGDMTSAFGLVNGEEVKFESDTFTGDKRPLATWVALLRTVSEN